ncbi:hypothetical protein MKW94_011825 [Papaver nudicaule]|uniref:TF-B3 domain-containing protein n=1 Tax=Papaver nudicaule TaxID=74823 RepID=A0AA41RTD5_PAPNU|nr:hypothetical protein [Papaver nudicaule]MCL7034793.1 hypothetical protein [Papaver nudicaule]
MDEAMLSVEERAEKIRSSLDPNTAILVRIMQTSQISNGFWMGIPKGFCVANMSKADNFMTLVDEQGLQFNKVTYLARKNGLSGGWKWFSEAHQLRKGDAVIFQLINIKTFKIYIVRKDIAAVGTSLKPAENLAKKRPRSTAPSVVVQDCDEVEDSEFLTDIKNYALPEHIRSNYYRLCCRHKSYLHANLVPDLDCNSVTSMISETVKIAEAIMSFRICNTSVDELADWKMILEEFAQLGMNVAVMISRLDEMLELSERVADSKRYGEFVSKPTKAKKKKSILLKWRFSSLKVPPKGLSLSSEHSKQRSQIILKRQ